MAIAASCFTDQNIPEYIFVHSFNMNFVLPMFSTIKNRPVFSNFPISKLCEDFYISLSNHSASKKFPDQKFYKN